uniref:Uncharacterized protein n=1 Tax=Falco tinnunculus TaxID=100819 RepID=A0A8C4UV42_FALTI
MSSLQFHFLQTLEHRTDVSVTSTSPWWEAPRTGTLLPLGSLFLQLCRRFTHVVRFTTTSRCAVLVCDPSWHVGSKMELSRRK